MLNFSIIGVETKQYEDLVRRIKNISKKHSVKANLNYINDVDEILFTKVTSIPAVRIMPGNLLLNNPSNNEIDSAIAQIILTESLKNNEENISTNRF